MKSFGVGESGGQELLLLTVPETARLLRIGRNTVYELVARGELPAVRLGRVIRIPRRRLLAWLECQANGPTEPNTLVADPPTQMH